MKFCIHIGVEKTGTTSLQSFFLNNFDYFASKGVIYPKSILDGVSHRKLVFLANRISHEDDFSRLNSLPPGDERQNIKDTILSEFRSEISSVHPDSTILIISEHFSSRLQCSEEVECLLSILSEFSTDISLHLYIRDPLDAALSSMSTRIKSGRNKVRLPVPRNTIKFDARSSVSKWDYKLLINRWQSVFESVNVHLFDKSEFLNHDLIHDFCHRALGIDISDKNIIAPDKNLNVRLSHESLILLAAINGLIPKFNEDGSLNQRWKGIAHFFESHLSDFGSSYIATPDQIIAYASYYQNSNEWVRKKFFPDRDFLFSSTTAKNTTSMPQSDPDVYINMASRIFELLWR